MDLIPLVLLTASGFLLLSIHDLSQIHRRKWLTVIAWVGYPIILHTYIRIIQAIAVRQPRLTLANGSAALVAAVAFALMIYSIFIEIPLHQRARRRSSAISTDSSTDSAPEARRVFRTGTYSLSRHPGFLWMSVLNFCLYFMAPVGYILVLVIVLTSCNLVLIIVEDRFIFPLIFAEYDEYRREVPFLMRLPRVHKKES